MSSGIVSKGVMCDCQFCTTGASWRCSAKVVAVGNMAKANFRVFNEATCGCANCRVNRPWKCKTKRMAAAAAAVAATVPTAAVAAPAAPAVTTLTTTYDLAYEAEKAQMEADLAKLWKRANASALLATALKLKEDARQAIAAAAAATVKEEQQKQQWEQSQQQQQDEDHYYDDGYDSEEDAHDSAELMCNYWDHFDTSREDKYKQSALRSIISTYVCDPSFQRLLLDKHHREYTCERIRNLATRAWFWESHIPLTAASDPQHVPHDSASIDARFIHQRLYRQFNKMLENLKGQHGYKA